MKKILSKLMYGAVVTLLCASVAGCDSYLNRQPDEALTIKEVFQKHASTLKYLYNVYGYIRNESDPSGRTLPWCAASDEGSGTFEKRGYSNLTLDTWSVASNPYRDNVYTTMYIGIREATYFMHHVYDCPEITAEEASVMHAEARFLRAYYYFCLMKVHGPVVLLGDNIVDFNDGMDVLAYRERNTWEECVNWVCSELDECARDLPATHNVWGRATSGAANALKARLLLYSARPLFNGNALYKSVITADGTHLFPETYDAEKWKKAADAALAVINSGTYSLVGEDGSDPYTSLSKVVLDIHNSEQIFVTEREGRPMRVVCTPVGVGGTAYGCGICPTQKAVDQFAMANGRYPITGYTDNNQGKPIIDPLSGYSESGFSTFTNPYLKKTLSTYNMYVNREPRFYRTIFYNGLNWIGGTNKVDEIQFYSGGNSNSSGQNHPTAGYGIYKFMDQNLNSKLGDSSVNWGYISWPLFRYAEILLNYAEAMIEYDPTDPNIFLYWNKVRTRAGLPNIEEVYPEAVGDQAKLRDLIHRERTVELCFENHRYFDTRTWMTSHTDDAGQVYGMNIEATDPNKFWKRTPVSSEGGLSAVRVFSDRCYLFPFSQTEVDRNHFTQNYGW